MINKSDKKLVPLMNVILPKFLYWAIWIEFFFLVKIELSIVVLGQGVWQHLRDAVQDVDIVYHYKSLRIC